jgi:putative tryptophan/tyrosine transport system substrate-binding protein
MRRREFITLVGSAAAAWPLVARAQQAPVRPIIGVLSPISIAAAARNTEALRTGLRDLGYSEGRNITLEQRHADGAIERLPDLAAELVALKPAVIVAGSPAAALAVRNATRSIPVVMNSSPDPVRLGLASSIARPGGNVTGFWWGDETLVGKRLGLLKEAVPGTIRAALMVHADDPTSADEIKQAPIVSNALDVTLRVLEVREPSEFEAAFAIAVREKMQGLCVSTSPLFVSHRTELAALAARARLPAVYAFRDFAAAGGLMSYGASLSDLYRRKAALIDKILKGASPADLPIERPITFELLINLKTAKALGLNIPPALLARVDEVIE